MDCQHCQWFKISFYPDDDGCTLGNMSLCPLDREDDGDDYEPDYEAMIQDREERLWL
jgi:hypothetical protein